MTAAVVSNAYYQKKQFYPSVVYITKSNPCMAVRLGLHQTGGASNWELMLRAILKSVLFQMSVVICPNESAI